MGARFTIALAQRVTKVVLRSSGLPPAAPFSSLLDSRRRNGSTTPLPCIDDVNIIRTSALNVDLARDIAAESFDGACLLTEPSKNVYTRDDYSIAIGLSWWRDRTLKVKLSHAKKLLLTTNPIVASRYAIPHEIQHVIGL